MRDYGTIRARFWTGSTGRSIRGNPEAQIVACYVMTCGHGSMTGLFYLALPTLAHETGLPLEGARKGLRSLSEAGFCHYDERDELVFVPNMAREQVGEALEAKDNRVKGIVKDLENYRKSAFYRDFYALYGAAYNLPEAKPLQGPLQAPSDPLRSQEQDQEQEQDQDHIRSQATGTKRGSAGRRAAPPAFDFEALYRRFPKRKGSSGKTKGIAKCATTVKTQAEYDRVGAAIDAYAATRADENPQFTMQFDTFMGEWEDFLPSPALVNGAADEDPGKRLIRLALEREQAGMVD